MFFAIVGDIQQKETIASGAGVRARFRLNKKYGKSRWRKLNRVARIRLTNGIERLAEVHWYEAHGIGQKEFKVKSFLD